MCTERHPRKVLPESVIFLVNNHRIGAPSAPFFRADPPERGGALLISRIHFICMTFDVPDYSYGIADSVLQSIDLLLRVGTDSENSFAKRKLEEAKAAMNDYKAAIFDQVMQT